MAKHSNDPQDPGRPRRGRPSTGGRITFRYAITATPEYRAWLESFVESLGEAEVSDVWRDAMRYYATEGKGFRPPPKR